MATSTQLLKDLKAELADIELQQQDPTLSHSDQHILDQAWDDILNQMDTLEESYEAWQSYMDRRANEWAGDDWPQEDEEEPRQAVTIAPPPPSVTRPSGVTKSGAVVAQRADGKWVAAPLPTFFEPLPIRSPPLHKAQTYEDDEEDDRPDCSRCAGCAYCEESGGYDHSAEI